MATQAQLRIDRGVRSVDALQRLYTIVIGLALTEGARRVIDPNLATLSGTAARNIPQSDIWMLFAVLVLTIVPFYHGANRHLDETYLFHTDGETRGSILLDFVVLFAEGVLFVMMAMSVLAPSTFFNLLLVLLGTDIIWAVITMLLQRTVKSLLKWSLTNFLALLLLFVTFHTPILPDDQRVLVLMWIAVGRTAADYGLNWQFYMGR